MSVSHGIVLGSPRSGTFYFMSVLNTIPDMECVSGTLMPVTIPFIANQDVSRKVYDALTIGFRGVIDSYLHSGRHHSRAAALQKWFRAPTGLSGLLQALHGPRPIPRMMVCNEPALSFAPEFVLDHSLTRESFISVERSSNGAGV